MVWIEDIFNYPSKYKIDMSSMTSAENWSISVIAALAEVAL